MVELKETDCKPLVEDDFLFYCKKCNFFAGNKSLNYEVIKNQVTYICPKCSSTHIEYILSSVDVYNFFVEKINKIREIVDVHGEN